ncbi:hypothetical protein C8J57DRAFT_1515059 [Mycena rebaudengoi]|nr:hypothetical protein C8J57DRAFT_1515059 [Mycena rebaudengoi]
MAMYLYASLLLLPSASASTVCVNGVCASQPTLNPAAIFGIVLGAVLLVMGGVLVFIFFWRRRKNKFQRMYVENAEAKVLAAGGNTHPMLARPPGAADDARQYGVPPVYAVSPYMTGGNPVHIHTGTGHHHDHIHGH